MATFGRPDATGRSSGERNGRAGASQKPPKGEAWVWQTRTLKLSPAWRALSIYGRMLIDFLEVEHMNHAGQSNGQLIATYGQLVKWGIPRKYVRATIFEATELRLITVSFVGGKDAPNRYELNTLPVVGRKATPNLWKRISEAEATAIKQQVAKLRTDSRGTPNRYPASNRVPHAGTTPHPHAGTTDGHDLHESFVANDTEGVGNVVPAWGTALISSRRSAGKAGNGRAIECHAAEPSAQA